MTKNEYNGWTNYETWVVNLWLTNDEGPYNYWREVASQAWNHAEEERGVFTKKERAIFDLADTLKDHHEQAVFDTEIENSFIVDLLNAAMSEVNWHEIAESLLEELEEES